VVHVAVRRDADAIDGPAVGAGRLVEQRLDLLLGGVGELPPVGVEELDAVVLRRIVGRGDDRAEVECEQRYGRCREHPTEDGVAADRHDTFREGRLQSGAGLTGVAADEDTATVGPECGGAAEPFDELRVELVADDPTDPVRAEEAARHEARGYRLLN
jgi:hypothetical protein